MSTPDDGPETAAPAGAETKRDIADRDDIYLLVSEFYKTAMVDDLLYEPFTVLRERGLESHLSVMCDFWGTMLLREKSYRGRALNVHRPIHARTTLGDQEFIRWLTLWKATVDEHFAGPVAEQAKIMGRRTAWAMHRTLNGHDSEELDRFVDREALIIR
ncbi:hypothetical protein MINS_37660 [Mycolicibacterium insubricum]|uniref:Uncharacterized protein n=1 Tax=Mycolicibacterium insubricum TaxID=444597 RepID=A0A1X0DMJ7_9MYCO|nr:group III truncated hemoglobin [Mycolicibacterium insubricum]MCB0928038.1 group III truncated hemoglobin [Mycobacterium sp.]MCV7080400.1 group III truncated hemoglobin [Mycolicibacterium insubricum]ORA73608.1 hypothetical protein BST26_02235 [Mycolicibacterium insubricum]BBZ68337.1 hypothetical protein MINS_37660 [Mycolicibacterium insubricum]